MLVVKLEVWPFGDEIAAREIGRAEVINIGGDDVSDYTWKVELENAPTMKGVLFCHERKRGPWELVRRVLSLERMGLVRPEIDDFATAVASEAQHQRDRWGSAHDAGKAPQDWFWLLGYLAGKALAAALAGDKAKALHHTISSAAALANWHAALLGADTRMRPGIEPPEGM